MLNEFARKSKNSKKNHPKIFKVSTPPSLAQKRKGEVAKERRSKRLRGLWTEPSSRNIVASELKNTISPVVPIVNWFKDMPVTRRMDRVSSPFLSSFVPSSSFNFSFNISESEKVSNIFYTAKVKDDVSVVQPDIVKPDSILKVLGDTLNDDEWETISATRIDWVERRRKRWLVAVERQSIVKEECFSSSTCLSSVIGIKNPDAPVDVKSLTLDDSLSVSSSILAANECNSYFNCEETNRSEYSHKKPVLYPAVFIAEDLSYIYLSKSSNQLFHGLIYLLFLLLYAWQCFMFLELIAVKGRNGEKFVWKWKRKWNVQFGHAVETGGGLETKLRGRKPNCKEKMNGSLCGGDQDDGDALVRLKIFKINTVQNCFFFHLFVFFYMCLPLYADTMIVPSLSPYVFFFFFYFFFGQSMGTGIGVWSSVTWNYLFTWLRPFVSPLTFIPWCCTCLSLVVDKP